MHVAVPSRVIASVYECVYVVLQVIGATPGTSALARERWVSGQRSQSLRSQVAVAVRC